MLTPSIDELLEKVENRYSLVITASKRARQIIDSQDEDTLKPVSKAVAEIYEGQLVFTDAE